jgi:hypothetical protein
MRVGVVPDLTRVMTGPARPSKLAMAVSVSGTVGFDYPVESNQFIHCGGVVVSPQPARKLAGRSSSMAGFIGASLGSRRWRSPGLEQLRVRRRKVDSSLKSVEPTALVGREGLRDTGMTVGVGGATAQRRQFHAAAVLTVANTGTVEARVTRFGVKDAAGIACGG